MTCHWPVLGSDECQCAACKREVPTGQGGDDRSYREAQARGTGRSGPFGGPDAVDAFSHSIEQFKKTHPIHVPLIENEDFQRHCSELMNELFVYGDTVKPVGPAGIAAEDEPAWADGGVVDMDRLKKSYPAAAPDFWFKPETVFKMSGPRQAELQFKQKIVGVDHASGPDINIEIRIDCEDTPDGFKIVARVVEPEPKAKPTDPQGWPSQAPFFPQGTIITPEAIWQPAPDWPRDAYFTDHLGERCFVTVSFVAHRMKTNDEWQAYVGGLPVREKNVESAGRYSTLEDAFAAALDAARKKANEKPDVPVSENPRGDSPLVSGPESGCAHPGEAQREESPDELRRYLDRVCPRKKLEGI